MKKKIIKNQKKQPTGNKHQKNYNDHIKKKNKK